MCICTVSKSVVSTAGFNLVPLLLAPFSLIVSRLVSDAVNFVNYKSFQTLFRHLSLVRKVLQEATSVIFIALNER